jgi:hypothetical protein
MNSNWDSHNHGPAEGRGLDCGEKPIGWCVRLAKDAELADLRAEVERLREGCERYGLPVGLDGLLRHIYGNRDLTIANWKAGAETWKTRAEVAEAKVARVEAVADQWEGLAGWLRMQHSENPRIKHEAHGHAEAARQIRAALDGEGS